MSTAPFPHDALAALFRYPCGDYRQLVERCLEAAGSDGGAAALLESFARQTETLAPEQLEELFTVTFDLNPVCSPEVGWHLYGEEYARGAFLVWARGELRRAALAESVELPDHLAHVLPLAARMEPQAAAEFCAKCLRPALDKMIAALAGQNNPYEALLRATAAFLAARHAPALTEISR